MNLEYSLDKTDYLTYQLYTASKSDRIKKTRQKAKFIPPVFFILIGGYLSNRDNSIFGLVMFAIIGVLWFIFYPKYLKRKYERHYRKYIDEHYSNRINIPTTLIIDNEYISSTNKTGESKIKISELNTIIELNKHFLLELKDKQTLIIPKKEIGDIETFRFRVQELKFTIEDQTNWKWK